MSTAREMYWEASDWKKHGYRSTERCDLLLNAADIWRQSGQHFSAGQAACDAVEACWGDVPRMTRCGDAIEHFRAAYNDAPIDSLGGLASTHMYRVALGRFFGRAPAHAHLREELARELLERIVEFFADSNASYNFLISGMQLDTDLEGQWTAKPDSTVSPNLQLGSSVIWTTPGVFSLMLPSAFSLAVSVADYTRVLQLAERFPGQLDAPGLRGWRHAARAFVNPESAPEQFAAASSAFAEDVPPSHEEIALHPAGWSGENVQLWAKYFRGRAALAGILAAPDRAHELIREAEIALEGTDSGIVNMQVTRFRILIRGLAVLTANHKISAIQDAIAELRSWQHWTGELDDDAAGLQFLANVETALLEFETDPHRAITSGLLNRVFVDMSRLPLIGERIADAIRPSVGKAALSLAEGPTRTFVHRALEAITDERVLHRLFLRLAQASVPQFAQVRHGPLEYGKDVVVLGESKGKNVLRMYQMKCGKVNKAAWREVQPQLEEMFQVPFSSINVNAEDVDVRIGVLVCNAHADPYVDPVMQGWFDEQRRAYQREYEFLHLDRLAAWISDARLVAELRSVLEESSIP